MSKEPTKPAAKAVIEPKTPAAPANESAIAAAAELLEQAQKNVAERAAPEKVERNKDLIYAKKGDMRTTFSALEWKLLAKDKGGWIEDVETPPEVENLKSK